MDSFTRAADPAYIEALYTVYRKSPEEVDPSWRAFFSAYDYFLQNGAGDASPSVAEDKEIRVRDLIQAYRSRGHLLATTNPVRTRKDRKPRLALTDFGLSEKDVSLSFSVGDLRGLPPRLPLSEILARLQKIYVGNIGFEYAHIRDPEILEWFKNKCEKDYPAYRPSSEEQTRILEKLNEAVAFEHFLHTKYVGQKRFSLEGGETAIAALDAALNRSAEQGVTDCYIGMAHRGRLNVLANTLRKTYDQIFHEFEGHTNPNQIMGDGDVKYHMGYASLVQTFSKQEIRLRLAPNPSHLEAVDPVVQGLVRAKIDGYGLTPQAILPILIHGDAALAGQGIVYEIVQMSQLQPYAIGGTLHFVINNQLGFTTDFDQARSSTYSTDVAKIIDAPILHVNGDDPEAVVFCMQLAIDYRQRFGKDVFVDMVCYRRHGHNESDEPKFTQPALYKLIANHADPRTLYLRTLLERKSIDEQQAKDMEDKFRSQLQAHLNSARKHPNESFSPPARRSWKAFNAPTDKDFETQPKTAISAANIQAVGHALITLPDGFTPIRQIEKLIAQRKHMFAEDKVLNWASAELLAYGSLLLEGKSVRLAGQDCQRGTFSHRHAVLLDANTNEAYNTLEPLATKDNHFFIYNSLLSEYGALGFEFGYSWAAPRDLVIWEAQFGDFANGAQVVIDQFLASAYTKWQRMSGLVLLLPHGYEGQGPEHSSARLERYLQLCAANNIFVCNITEPANFFHLLRRQLYLPFRIPCVVMSPKSLFRHPRVQSPLSAFSSGTFRPLIDDAAVKAEAVKKVLVCSGKLYYDLLDAREQAKRKDIAILRLEQLHPFPVKEFRAAIARYKHSKALCWVQEEPRNMGAHLYLLRVAAEFPWTILSRQDAASPASGYYKVHLSEQRLLIEQAFS